MIKSSTGHFTKSQVVTSWLKYSLFLLHFFSISPLFSINNASFSIKEMISDPFNKFIEKGDSCMLQEKFNLAIENYLQAQRLLDGNIESLEQQSFYNKLGEAYYMIGNFEQALVYFNRVRAFSASEIDDLQQAIALKGTAHILWRMGDNVPALSKILESLDIFQKHEDTAQETEAFNILAGIYIELGNLDEANAIYREMLNQAERLADSINMATNLEYIGIVYFFKEDYKNALRFYLKSLEINLLLNSNVKAAINNANIGEAYMKMGDIEKALDYFDDAYKTLSEFEVFSPLVFTSYSIGQCYTILKQYDLGLKYYNESLDLIQQIGEFREEHVVLELIAENYAERGDFENAYNFLRNYSVKKDQLFNTEKDKQMQEIKAKYEKEKTEQENIYLSKENTQRLIEIEAKKKLIERQFFIGVLLLVLLIIAFYLAIKLYLNRLKLSVSNDAKDKIFSIISHDLRGPIGNIKTLAEFLEQDLPKEEREQLQKLLKNTSQTVFILVKDLLSWSFTQKGGFNLTPTILNLQGVVDKSIALLEYQAENKGIVVQNQTEDEFMVYADENALSIICRNLLSNAIKFTNSGGKIEFSANMSTIKAKPAVELIVKDNGLGMREETIANLLKGKRTKSSKGTSMEEGSGFGFSLIMSFVSELKGAIKIESTVGQGTIVKILLPSGE